MQFSGSLDQFQVIFGPPNSTSPELRKPRKTGVKLCTAVFFKSQAQWPKYISKGAGCIGEVHGVGVRRGGMEGLFASTKGTLEVMLEKYLQPLFTTGRGGAGVGQEDNRTLCCPAIKAHAKQIMWPARWEHCSIRPSA